LPLQQHAVHATTTSTTAASLVVFAHAMMFSPALSTLEEALWQGHIPEFSGLILQSLQIYPPQSNQPDVENPMVYQVCPSNHTTARAQHYA